VATYKNGSRLTLKTGLIIPPLPVHLWGLDAHQRLPGRVTKNLFDITITPYQEAPIPGFTPILLFTLSRRRLNKSKAYRAEHGENETIEELQGSLSQRWPMRYIGAHSFLVGVRNPVKKDEVEEDKKNFPLDAGLSSSDSERNHRSGRVRVKEEPIDSLGVMPLPDARFVPMFRRRSGSPSVLKW
jgi:hypothetical protein